MLEGITETEVHCLDAVTPHEALMAYEWQLSGRPVEFIELDK